MLGWFVLVLFAFVFLWLIGSLAVNTWQILFPPERRRQVPRRPASRVSFCGQSYPVCQDQPNEDDEKVLDIDDPSVPLAVREHGRRFRNPAQYVISMGHGEYILFGEDGELLDAIHLKNA